MEYTVQIGVGNRPHGCKPLLEAADLLQIRRFFRFLGWEIVGLMGVMGRVMGMNGGAAYRYIGLS